MRKRPTNIQGQDGGLTVSHDRTTHKATRLRCLKGKVLQTKTVQKYRFVNVVVRRTDVPGRNLSHFHNPAEGIAQAIADSMNPDKVSASTPAVVKMWDTMSDDERKEVLAQHNFHRPAKSVEGYYGSQPEIWDLLHMTNFSKRGAYGRRFFVNCYKSMKSGRPLSQAQINLIFKIRNTPAQRYFSSDDERDSSDV